MKHITLEMPTDYNLAMFGDLHYAVKGFPHETVQRAIDWIKSDKKNYWASGGDMIDAMSPQDKRFVFGQNEPNYNKALNQAQGVIELLDPIADSLLWGIMGNHEARYRNTGDWTKFIMEGLDCEIYGKDEESAYLLKAQLNDIKVLDWHGSGYISSNANDDYIMKENERRSVKKKLRRMPGDDCEVLVMHHIHKQRIVPPTDPETLKMSSINGELKAYYSKPTRKYLTKEKYYYDINDRWYASSGAFLPVYTEGFSGYGDINGYRPSEMGFTVVEVRNDKVKRVREQVF